MIERFLATLLSMLATAAFAAVDVNQATVAELEMIKGVGPSMSSQIIDERSKGPFKDWRDLIDRVKSVGEGNAAKFSTEGLTVNGAPFSGAASGDKKVARSARSGRPAAAAARSSVPAGR